MASLPVIYTIQVSDAPQHTDRLREILQNLKTGNRISGFSISGPDDDLLSLAENVVEDDMILIVLTDELETHKGQIELRFRTLKDTQPGEKEILLTAFKKRKQETFSRNLEIKSPPLADFEIRNNGCTAPCSVEFINTTSGASSYSWDFGNGTASEEARTEVRYQSTGEYEVTLIATNTDGVSSEAKKSATIIQDDSPFADFTFSGNRGQLPREVTFTNHSQNGDSCVWQFQGGIPATSSSQSPPAITYRSYGEFVVTLTTGKNDGRNHQQVKVVQVSSFPSHVDQIFISPQLLRQLELSTGVQDRSFRQLGGVPLNQ